MRQERVRHRRNAAYKSRLKTAIKRVFQGIESGDVSAARQALSQAVPIIDKTCSKGVIHKNKAARHKSRLTRRVNALAAQVGK
jgi:small subunit ribosomal protein S20